MTATTVHTADVIVLNGPDWDRRVLLVRRSPDSDAHPGEWALPGGKLEPNEVFRWAAARELAEETGLVVGEGRLVLNDVHDAPDRDPRGRYISISYVVQLSDDVLPPVRGADDVDRAEWVRLIDITTLAFDHLDILRGALAKRDLLPGGAALPVPIEFALDPAGEPLLNNEPVHLRLKRHGRKADAEWRTIRALTNDQLAALPWRVVEGIWRAHLAQCDRCNYDKESCFCEWVDEKVADREHCCNCAGNKTTSTGWGWRLRTLADAGRAAEEAAAPGDGGKR